MTKPGIEEKSQQVLWNGVGLRLYFKYFGEGVAIRTLMFCRILAKFEDLDE